MMVDPVILVASSDLENRGILYEAKFRLVRMLGPEPTGPIIRVEHHHLSDGSSGHYIYAYMTIPGFTLMLDRIHKSPDLASADLKILGLCNFTVLEAY